VFVLVCLCRYVQSVLLKTNCRRIHSNTGCWSYYIISPMGSIWKYPQFYFVFGRTGQDIVKDIRIKLFKHIPSFRMKYFDLVPVGQLVTLVSIWYWVQRAYFQSGIIYDHKWLNEDGGRIALCSHELAADLDCGCAMPVLVFITRIFQRKMQVVLRT
jgi:ABC-type multidrug transport system fused ATPase/permease subunit